MAQPIKSVAVAGASGYLGTRIVPQLLQSGFSVTIIARKPNTFPAGATVNVIDFASNSALQEAIRGHDAVVDATSAMDDTTVRLIDAAAAVGVKRFIPSAFGLDINNARLAEVPFFVPSVERHKHLWKKCAETGMTWSSVCNGALLDWNLETGFLEIRVRERRAILLDGGKNPHVWTTSHDVARAVAGILEHPSETANRAVYVNSIVKSEAQVLELAQEALGSDGWEISNADGQQTFAKAMGDLQAGNHGLEVFSGLLRFANAQAYLAHPWAASDNELVGVSEMPDKEVKELIRRVASA